MDFDKIKSKITAGVQYEKEYNELRELMSQTEKELEHIEQEVRQNPTIISLQNRIKVCASKPVKRRLVGLFDNLLTKLISKRVVMEIDGKKMAMSYSGISVDEFRRYYSWQNETFQYIPTISNTDDKWHKYLQALDHYIMLRNRLHKRDKKEIMTICGRFVKQYRQLTHMTELESDYTPLGEDYQLNYIFKEWSYSATFTWTTKTLTINKIKIRYGSEGIEIRTMYDEELKSAVNIYADMDKNDCFLLLELLKNEKIRDAIEMAIRKYEQSKQEFTELVNELEDNLQPYAVLDLF